MGEEVVFQQRKVGHGHVHHGRKRIAAVFDYNNVPSPSVFLPEVRTLNITNAAVDRERHAIAGDGRVKQYIWRFEASLHVVQ